MSNRESPEQVASEILSCVYGTSRTAQEDRVGQWIAAAIRARDAEHAAELAELQAQLAGMRAALTEARAYGERLYAECAGNARGVACAYCGEVFAEGTPSHQNDALTEHGKACEKHPMRAADQRVRELEAQCAGMRAVIDEAMRMWAIVVDSDYERSATSTEWEAWAAMAAILPDAGKELLERVGEALTYIANAKRDIPGGWAAAYGGDWKGWIEKAERRLRAALGEGE